MPENSQVHYDLSGDLSTMPCAELQRRIEIAQQRRGQNSRDILEAEAAMQRCDKEAEQWQALEHAAWQDAIADEANRPMTDHGKAFDRWKDKLTTDENAVKQAHDEVERLTKLGDDELEKIKQLHREQEQLDRWLDEAMRQRDARCPSMPEVAQGPGKLVKVAAGVVSFGLVVGGGWLLRPVNKPTPRTDVPVAQAPVGDNHVVVATTLLSPKAPTVSGDYRGEVAVTEDPAGHKCCVKPAATWHILQQRNTKTGEITIQLTGVLPGITLTAPLEQTGDSFTAVTHGTVAGYPNVEVRFAGAVSPDGGLHGDLLVGGNKALPKGLPIMFHADLAKAA
jgi:hypothetical protein